MCRKSICLMILIILGSAGTLTAGELIKINFQLAGADVPEGYLPDTGQEFGDQGNGYSYGWSQNMSDQTRDRDNAAAQDQRYDTLIHFRARGAVWEIELPPGFYRVFIVCGDPSYADTNNAIVLEGELLAEDPDGEDSYDEFEFIVLVTDGRLTWAEPEGTYVKPCFIEIESSHPVVKATKPDPGDGAIIGDTWANLTWQPGEFAVSHDLYVGDSHDAVSESAEGTFVGNQTDTFLVVGFPGFPYPDGLVPGMTYYWRVDEVNDADPNSPWIGDVWSFMVPPKTAYNPEPVDTAESVELDSDLSWTPGFGAKLHTVYFGDNFDEVNNAEGNFPQGATTYDPGQLELAKTYYWRVDEFDATETHKGNVWSFFTEGAVGSPDPAKGAVDVTQTPVLKWTPGVFADTHEIYFGDDPASLELKGSGNLGSESFESGLLEWNTTYYWRIDEANNANADSPWTGPLWSFTTANFLIIDDFEAYNDIAEGEEGSNRMYIAWVDGYDNPAINGSVVGNDPPPIAEQTVVHSGLQSMPMTYDNAVGKSEATLTLTSNRDWTVKGVDTLTIWFRGKFDNAAEPLYVALNDSAVVTHDKPNAAQLGFWTEWNIPLQAFADQGVNLTNVNSITLGLGNRNNPVAGGAGTMYFDDIRLYAP